MSQCRDVDGRKSFANFLLFVWKNCAVISKWIGCILHCGTCLSIEKAERNSPTTEIFQKLLSSVENGTPRSYSTLQNMWKKQLITFIKMKRIIMEGRGKKKPQPNFSILFPRTKDRSRRLSISNVFVTPLRILWQFNAIPLSLVYSRGNVFNLVSFFFPVFFHTIEPLLGNVQLQIKAWWNW